MAAKKPGVDPETLIDQAWGLVAEALDKGQLTLPGREAPMILQPEHVVRLCQWLAHQKKRAPKLTSQIEDFALPGESDD